jgi:transposase-like protein
VRARDLNRQYRRPRRMTPALRADICRRYFARYAKQIELAREYHVSQSTISRIISFS